MPVTSAASAGTEESYSAMLDGNSILSIFGRSDGAGGLSQYGLGIGTSTTAWLATFASSTQPQLSLSAGAGLAQTVFRNTGSSFYISSTTVAGTATTSTPLLDIALGGFGTTTVRGLSIIGQATSTSNVGFNITGGCFAINGNCVGGSSAVTYDAWTHPQAGFSATTSALVIGTSTAATNISALTISSSTAGQLALSAGSGFGLWSFRNAGGNLYVGTTTVAGTATTTTPALTILNNGRVGLGSTSPTSRLSIVNNAADVTNLAGLFTLDNGAGTASTTFGASGFTANDTLGSFGQGPFYKFGGTSGPSNGGNYFVIEPAGDNSNANALRVGASSLPGLIVKNVLGSGPAVSVATGTPSVSGSNFVSSLTSYSSTGSQLALSAGAGLAQWAFRNAGGNFYLSTTTVAGTSTTTLAALSINVTPGVSRGKIRNKALTPLRERSGRQNRLKKKQLQEEEE
jgi:hypothetical protein